MIILDTNVLSEVMKRVPATAPLAWLASQRSAEVFTTAVCQSEILYGIRAMPEGRRRNELEAVVRSILEDDFSGRILPFDSAAADHYAIVAARRRAMGRPVREFDAQIAAIALAYGASLATRNVRDFEQLDLDIIDPWGFEA